MLSFYRGKNVFITGHTGFKGSWLAMLLLRAGANVTGYALRPAGSPDLFALCHLQGRMNSVIGDILDFSTLKKTFDQAAPEIVFHLAAQPLVGESYQDPRSTYETNVMGTVNVLECVRQHGNVKSVVNVTTDKVYKNQEWAWGYRETDVLCGFDPYSNSKSCSELVTNSYVGSFLKEAGVAVSTARAGNVIGGGDFAKDRILPDCIRYTMASETIRVRNPGSIRPYQHVLEALYAYLLIAEKQYHNPFYADCYNIGPDYDDCITTGKLVTTFCDLWGRGAKWEAPEEKGDFHEAKLLKLDCSKIKDRLAWRPIWRVHEAVGKCVEWTKAWVAGDDVQRIIEKQATAYEEGISHHG